MLAFDSKMADAGKLPLKITDGMTGRQFLFKITGVVHGQLVFTDQIHYLLKGGKLMKCALAQVNRFRDLAMESRQA